MFGPAQRRGLLAGRHIVGLETRPRYRAGWRRPARRHRSAARCAVVACWAARHDAAARRTPSRRGAARVGDGGAAVVVLAPVATRLGLFDRRAAIRWRWHRVVAPHRGAGDPAWGGCVIPTVIGVLVALALVLAAPVGVRSRFADVSRSAHRRVREPAVPTR